MTADSQPPNQSSPIDSGLYQALMRHYVHQNQFVWQTIPYLVSVQGAALAVGYLQHPKIVGSLALALGLLLTALLWLLFERFQRDRDVNEKVMQRLGALLLHRFGEIRSDDGKLLSIALRSHSTWGFLRGRHIIRGVLGLFILIDFLFILSYIGCLSFLDFLYSSV